MQVDVLQLHYNLFLYNKYIHFHLPSHLPSHSRPPSHPHPPTPIHNFTTPYINTHINKHPSTPICIPISIPNPKTL